MEQIQKAIQLAISQGWTPNMFSGADWTVKMVRAKQCDEKTFLDPLFWQSLGKSLGWSDDGVASVWEYYWHEFISHLAEGKPANDFFKHLLE